MPATLAEPAKLTVTLRVVPAKVQDAMTQFDGQLSPFTVLPSSQVSTPCSRKPSPQTALWHCAHASALLSLPSSHSSTPVSMKPSPQVASLHALVQASVLLLLPSSHSSPGISVIPFPQVKTIWQATQPFDTWSHSSTPAW